MGEKSILLQKKERSSNIELFRIITMIIIVAHHYVVNSGLSELVYNSTTKGFNDYFLSFFGWGGKTGINCFVFITGYFMCRSNITVKKFVKLLFEIEFYNIVIYAIFVITGYSKLSGSQLLLTLLPVKSIGTDFTSCYILFFLLIPFLNVFVKALTQKQHLCLIFVLLFIFSVIPVLGILPFLYAFYTSINYIEWFVVLYVISSYVGLHEHEHKIFENTRLWLIATAGTLLASFVSIVILPKLHINSSALIVDSNKPLAVATAFSAFMLFKNIKIKNSKFINRVVASTFGVLLIHANSDVMRQWLWKDTLSNVSNYDSKLLVLHAVGSVLGVYIICTVIDMLVKQLIEKPVFILFDKYYGRLESKVAARIKNKKV